jgi:hypothetical protein
MKLIQLSSITKKLIMSMSGLFLILFPDFDNATPYGFFQKFLSKS